MQTLECLERLRSLPKKKTMKRTTAFQKYIHTYLEGFGARAIFGRRAYHDIFPQKQQATEMFKRQNPNVLAEGGGVQEQKKKNQNRTKPIFGTCVHYIYEIHNIFHNSLRLGSCWCYKAFGDAHNFLFSQIPVPAPLAEL